MENIDVFVKKISDEAHEHSSIPFWSWNDKLDKDLLGEQIKDMKKLGMRGFFMHARAGLETEYLSKEWFDAVRYCVNEGKRLGMEAWAYDENGWPSGFGGGKLLRDEKNLSAGIKSEIAESFPKPSDDILGVYTMTDKGVTRHTCDCGAPEYIIVRRTRDHAYVDVMNPEITKQFIACTHERYKEELGDDFGGAMPGFFTDEPQYTRTGTPWSDTFLVTFKKKYGYDVLDMLPAMFYDYEGAESHRYDYYLLCHESFYNGFMKPIYEWCDANGVKLTGHAVEEWNLNGQMGACAGVMPFYMYEHIPGIDYLHRSVRNINGAKQFGSVCEQTGKTVRLTESFACCGWDVTPREIKRIAELQFAGGVNLICEHLYAFSERGQRKRDYPNHYSEHNTWHKYFDGFERHFANLGSALAQGREIADTLVIHPMRSAYLHYKRALKAGSIAELEKAYEDFIIRMSEDHIPFHLGDEGIMEIMGSVEGNKIRIGKCVYDTVIIPCCETLTTNTVRMLDEYMSNGGKLCILGCAPTRIDGHIADRAMPAANITYEDISDASCIKIKDNIPVHMQLREVDGKKLLFLANTSENVYNDVEITLTDCEGICELDIDTLEYRPVRGTRNSDGSVTVLYSFGDSASCLLVENDMQMSEPLKSRAKEYISLDRSFELVSLPENMLTLDNAHISKDGTEFTEARPIVRIKDNLFSERYEGRLTLRYTFDVRDIPEKLLLVAEPMRYISVRVNGNEVEKCGEYRIDRRFFAYDIAAFTVKGENTVDMEIDYFQRDEVYDVLYGGGCEAARNCLCFDTEVEAVYLYGSFCVGTDKGFVPDVQNTFRSEGDFYLYKQDKAIDLKDIVRDGYPFFAGELEATTEIDFKEGDPTLLKLGGRFAVCGVTVNGKDLGMRLFGDEFELAPYLKEGRNAVSIKLCVSNRNLLGPHHVTRPEPTSVLPTTFSFELMWNGAECPKYVPSYAFVRLGIGF